MVAPRLVMAVLVALSLTVSLSACGKRGSLTAPDGSTYPQQYPKQ